MNKSCDIFIVGSGLVGATYAQSLVEKGYTVIMADVGEQESPLPGAHKKNTTVIRKDRGKFASVIEGSLTKVSVQDDRTVINNLDPTVWQTDQPFRRNGMNPAQDPSKNLPGEAVARVVGGMATLWTCVTPRFHKLELPPLHYDDPTGDKSCEEWQTLYDKAERLIGTRTDHSDGSKRHKLVLSTLNERFPDRSFQTLPLACTPQSAKTETFFEWNSAHTIFKFTHSCFELLTNTLCRKLVRKNDHDNTIISAELFNVKNGEDVTVQARVFVIAAGAVGTPQILVNSGFNYLGLKAEGTQSLIPNLGKYITAQWMSFCQVILYQKLVDSLKEDIKTCGTPGQSDYKVYYDKSDSNHNPDSWNNEVVKHMHLFPEDPIPIPLTDEPPQVFSPFAAKSGFNWPIQINRDVVSYGTVAKNIDNRLILDIRGTGRTHPHKSNQLYFSELYNDAFGMPQPTFHYSTKDARTKREANEMKSDMINIAKALGGFMPESGPRFTEPGSALHLAGTHRSGLFPDDSVVDIHSKVWGFPNLFLGGVGNIPTAFGNGPALTAIAYAIKSCDYIKANFPLQQPHRDEKF